MEDQQEVETGVWTNKRTQRDHWQPIVFVHAPLHFDKKNTDANTYANTDANTDANTKYHQRPIVFFTLLCILMTMITEL